MLCLTQETTLPHKMQCFSHTIITEIQANYAAYWL
jgi:hypothetical protein